MSVKTAAQLVVLCENALGWQPPGREPISKARKRQADRITSMLRERPSVTLADLELAVELLRSRRMDLKAPHALFHFVDEARKRGTATHVAAPLAEQVTEAITWEHHHEAPGADEWMTRLTRARGTYREDVLKEWRQARGVAA